MVRVTRAFVSGVLAIGCGGGSPPPLGAPEIAEVPSLATPPRCTAERWEEIAGPFRFVVNATTLSLDAQRQLVDIARRLAQRNDLVLVRMEIGIDEGVEDAALVSQREVHVGRLLMRGGIDRPRISALGMSTRRRIHVAQLGPTVTLMAVICDE